MAGKTDQTKLQFLFKKALGFANTSNIKAETEETAGSVWQLGTNVVFGENVPASPTVSDGQFNLVQGGTVEYLALKAFKIAGSTYDANDSGGGGDGAQDPGPHAYGLYLPGTYQADSNNLKKGSGKFINNLALSASDGGLQLVGPNFSSTSPNPYQITLFEDDGSGGIGDQIVLTDETDWMVDYYNGIIFLQDYDSTKIPAHAKAFIYTGNYASDYSGQAMAVSGSAGRRVDRILMLSGANAPTEITHAVSDVAYTGDPANYTDTSFFVSGSVGAVANNISGSAVFGGDLYISGVQYFGELRTGIVPANPPDGRVALYGKDDSGTTKLYFRNEAGETEVGSGGGGGTPGGDNTELQYNNAGTFGGISDIKWTGVLFDVQADCNFNGTVVINQSGVDEDLRVETANKTAAILTDGSTDQVMILSGTYSDTTGYGSSAADPDPRTFADTNFFVSGAIGAITTGTSVSPIKGTSVFGGDTLISGSLYVKDEIIIKEYIRGPQSDGGGDADTFIRMTTNDVMQLRAGGVTMIQLREGAVDDVWINPNAADMDFLVYGTDANNPRIKFDAGTNQLLLLSGTASTKPGHAPNESDYKDIAFFVSGSVGSKNSPTIKGVALFGGDTVVSGTLIANRSDDGENAAIKIDKDYKGTGDVGSFVGYGDDASGLLVDYDVTGIVASGKTAYHDAISVHYNQNVPTHVGTINATGADIRMTGGTSGAQAMKGVAISLTGADTNTGIDITVPNAGTHIIARSPDNPLDHFMISVDTAGATTLSTSDADASAATLILDADGALNLDGSAGINIGASAYVPVDFNADTLDIDALGTVSIDSLGGLINIGTEDNDFNISIGTAGARIVRLGNSDGSIDIDAGEYGIALDSVGVISLNGGGSPAAGTDVNFFVSGAMGSRGGTSRGTSTFGGDINVSGSMNVGSTGNPSITALNVYANVSADWAAKIDNDQSSDGHVLKLLTDGNGSGSKFLDMEDGDGDILFRARADGRFGFGAAGVSSMGAGTFVVGIDGSHTADIAISKRLQHLGDSDTYLEFPANDQMSVVVGNHNFIEMKEDAGTPDDLKTLFILSGTQSSKPGHSPDESGYTDTAFFVSGSVGSANTGVKGTALFGGDIVVSGSITNLGGDTTELSGEKGFTSLNNNEWFDIDSFSTGDTLSVLYNISGHPNNTTQDSRYDRFTSELLVVVDGKPGAVNTPVFTEKRAHMDYNKQGSGTSNYLDSTNATFRFTQSANVCLLQMSGSLIFVNGCGDGAGGSYPPTASGGALKLKFKRLKTII